MVDILLVVIAALSIYRGWRSGLLKSALSLIGFIGGGLVGLIVGIQYLNNVINVFGKFALYLLFISIGSTVGEIIMARIGQTFHDKVLFAPFKWLDSILGATFELLKAAAIIYIVFSLITATHWQLPEKYLSQSKIYSNAQKVIPSFIKSEVAKLKF